MATTMFLCTLHLLPSLKKISLPRYFGFRPAIHLTTTTPFTTRRISWCSLGRKPGISPGRLLVLAATEGSAKPSQSDEKIPSWAKPDTDEPPPWARNEGNASTAQPEIQIPFYVYLLASAVIAIAAIGSAFEYVNQKPVFGVLNSDSVFYAPLLGFFAFTGIPTSAFLWFKSVQVANKEAEEQDRRDGYL